VADLSRYPARRGFEDVTILCAETSLELAWSAVAFPDAGFVWFALRNPKLLTCTLLWFSNGGRDYPPWNGRHVNVLGVEDMTGFFQVGLGASSRSNALTLRGVQTCLEPRGGRLSIPYIQGVARIPEGFDRLAAVVDNVNAVRLIAATGVEVSVPCETDFLRRGELQRLGLPRP
jgi:hypothetical protein